MHFKRLSEFIKKNRAWDAALLGASLHGMAGARLRSGGVDGVLASEIADALRPVIAELRS